ncbi:family 78 glycoside hydrolase catalytic domain [Actomonas aquatica]|uniref:alpha-L-rhamnosidase n=1 Tax=Actomonas aquatica TaxID=2866162 RepID=A0ABZ1CET6_9BACT|nr:family 78 glycoside hydrolase catalytic domain [Opitutus sp. WL0086]WRQ89927.1 family 78 glycoside hydrolase catalytic domain [Opitutus sp. WL0086]
MGEGFVDPLGFHDATPRFSWQLPDGVERQSAYHVQVTAPGATWDSGWVESDQSVFVPYGGEPLHSREAVTWRVRYKDQDGAESAWSESARFELGLLSAADWTAQWIRPSQSTPDRHDPVASLRRHFALSKDIVSARLYVTARGVFELQLNGQPVGRDVFANGWTSYHHRLDTLTYDVTAQLQAGNNALAAKLGSGWYAGRLGWKDNWFIYGKHPELLLQLEVKLADGSVETVVSDGAWEGTFEGPIVSSGFYDGEIWDARRPVSGWAPVTATPELGEAALTPKPFTPVRPEHELAVQGITEPEPGRYVFDLGQNMVGWPRLRVPMTRDGTLTVRFAELLNPDGTLYTENYRSAKSTNVLTAAADGVVEWEPTFTFHGFRYVELSGLPAGVTPQADWVTGVVLHSALRPIGHFTSSHAILNQLQRNIVWGQRGNFLDIPTDCPQRDERLGWTGDAQVFSPTASFNYDSLAFWKSWLGSMRDDQLSNGEVPSVIPNIKLRSGSPGWVDAATFIPWDTYVRTGDVEILAENFAMMVDLVGWYRGQTVDGLLPNIKGYGDWLQPHATELRGDTPSPLLGLAFYARSTQIVADAAAVLGKRDEAQRFAAEAAEVRATFAAHYFDAAGRLQNAPETQTACVLALAFDLLPKDLQQAAAANLVRLVREAGNHLRTGFLGTPHLVRVLDEQGYPDLAYTLLLQESYPSWFYSIHQGATTMWERWNSYSHEDGFGDATMNSFNHYAYGAIGQWMYERVAGLAPDPAQPGYRHFYVRPLIGGGLQSARAELETAYGRAASGWRIEGDTVHFDVVVPANTSATLQLPDGRAPQPLTPGKHHFTMPWPQP